MRRIDSQRIFEAQREGLRKSLRDEWQMSEELAGAVVEERDLQAARRVLSRNWRR